MNILTSIAEKVEQNRSAIEQWFQEKEAAIPHPLFVSCDIRHSGHKIAVVDTNLFPAGFNNLCKTYKSHAAATLTRVFETRYKTVQKILLLAESHTRNKFYFENLFHLSTLLKSTGREVQIAMSEPDFNAPMTLTLREGEDLLIHPLSKSNVDQGSLQLPDGFTPDLILSNNDFSTPLPDYWREVRQEIVPAPTMGWQNRRKSRHFALAEGLLKEFAALIGLESWEIACHFDTATGVDLANPSDIEILAEKTGSLLQIIETEHHKRGLDEPPYLFLKSDSGTYGMGISTLYSAEELTQLNRKLRNKLLSSKGEAPNDNFLLQEGIPTIDFYSEQPIEPVIYLVGGEVIGGFFRMNPLRDAYASLNSRGMEFSCLCLHKLDEPHEIPFIRCAEKSGLIQVSVLLARISSLAAGLESLEV